MRRHKDNLGRVGGRRGLDKTPAERDEYLQKAKHSPGFGSTVAQNEPESKSEGSDIAEVRGEYAGSGERHRILIDAPKPEKTWMEKWGSILAIAVSFFTLLSGFMAGGYFLGGMNTQIANNAKQVDEAKSSCKDLDKELRNATVRLATMDQELRSAKVTPDVVSGIRTEIAELARKIADLEQKERLARENGIVVINRSIEALDERIKKIEGK